MVVEWLAVVERALFGFLNGRSCQMGTSEVLDEHWLSKRCRWGFEWVWVGFWAVIAGVDIAVKMRGARVILRWYGGGA